MLSWMYAASGTLLLIVLNVPALDRRYDIQSPGHYLFQIGWLAAGILIGRALTEALSAAARQRGRDLGART